MIPYQPELPLRAVDVVNYNQTVRCAELSITFFCCCIDSMIGYKC